MRLVPRFERKWVAGESDVISRSCVFRVTDCDLERTASSGVSWNMKSAGKRWMFRLTAWFRTLTGTP